MVFERTDAIATTRLVARKGSPSITLRGEVGELVLRSYGRTAVNLETDGTAAAVAAFNSAPLGI